MLTGTPPAQAAVLEHATAKLVLEAFGPAERRDRLPRHRARDRAYRAAMELIHDESGQRMSVLELCRRAHTSERTLRNAFRERLGVSPKTYLKAVSLQRVRDALKREPHDDVLEVAGGFG